LRIDLFYKKEFDLPIWNFFFEALTYSSLAARNMLGQFFDIAGFSPIEIGYLMAMIPVFALVSNPLWFRIGSKITDKNAFTILMMVSVKKHGGAFGRIRLFGTVGFAITALLLSGLVKWGFIWYFIVTSISLFLAPFVINVTLTGKGTENKKLNVSSVRNGNLFTFVIMIIGMTFGITLGSFHNTFFPVLSRQLGYDKSFVGLIYAFMAFTEVPFLFFAERIIKKMGNFNVLITGIFASALRVLLITYVTEMMALFLIESLHGLTYILMYYALFNYIHFKLPEKYLVNAQSLFWLVSSGLTYILGSIVGGYLIEFFNTLAGFRIMGFMGFAATGVIVLISITFKRKTA